MRAAETYPIYGFSQRDSGSDRFDMELGKFSMWTGFQEAPSLSMDSIDESVRARAIMQIGDKEKDVQDTIGIRDIFVISLHGADKQT